MCFAFFTAHCKTSLSIALIVSQVSSDQIFAGTVGQWVTYLQSGVPGGVGKNFTNFAEKFVVNGILNPISLNLKY